MEVYEQAQIDSAEYEYNKAKYEVMEIKVKIKKLQNELQKAEREAKMKSFVLENRIAKVDTSTK